MNLAFSRNVKLAYFCKTWDKGTSTRERPMTKTEQQTHILAAIKGRGWASYGLYIEAANELHARGQIKLTSKYTANGDTKFVWVAA